jgi:hypothetical protein
VKAPSLGSLVENLQKSVNQLGGTNGEEPPTGYQRVADVRLEPTSTLFQHDRQALLESLRGKVMNLDNLSPKDTKPGLVLLTNQHGTHIFSPDELK